MLAMASRRGAWLRALAVYQEDAGGIHRENDENVDPMLGGEVETMVQERHVLVRCQPRRQPRTPLRDITHLFPGSGNVASLDDKTDLSPPIQQGQLNGPVRRPLPPASSQNFRKRRQPEPSSETPTLRRVLPRFR